MACALVLGLARNALAGPKEARPVLTAGGGFGSIQETDFCDPVGHPCPSAKAAGPAVLLAGGAEWTPLFGSTAFAARAEVQLGTVLDRDSWALHAGPMLTMRFAIFELGGGLALLRVSGPDASRSKLGGAVHMGVALPLDRWTPRGGLDLVRGHEILGGLLTGSVSRRF